MMGAMKICAVFLLAVSMCQGAEWSQWRGPDRDGISKEKNWAGTFGPSGPKVLWEAQVGVGFSSFVTGEGRAYVTGHAEGKDTIFCFEVESGREVWKHSYPAALGDKYFEGGTTGTPTLAGGKLYHLSRWGDLMSLDAVGGRVIWQKNIQQETGLELPDWGFSGAPLVWGDWLILNVGDSGVAVKQTDGSVVWRSKGGKAGYSTPYPYEQDGKTLVILGTAKGYVAVEAKTGRKVWEHRWNTSYGVNAADPIVHDGHVFISTGYNKGAAMLKLGGNQPEELWTTREMRTQMNAAMLVDGYLYGVDGDERKSTGMKCLEFKTGKPMWGEKSIGHGAVMVADGKLIGLSEKGELFIAAATPEGFAPVARAQVLNGKCWTVPVLSGGLLLVRDATGAVKCLDLRVK
jgi:outer membrane protein assembly factor BamB